MACLLCYYKYVDSAIIYVVVRQKGMSYYEKGRFETAFDRRKIAPYLR